MSENLLWMRRRPSRDFQRRIRNILRYPPRTPSAAELMRAAGEGRGSDDIRRHGQWLKSSCARGLTAILLVGGQDAARELEVANGDVRVIVRKGLLVDKLLA